MNKAISDALMKLIGDGQFKAELRSLLDGVENTDEVSRAVEVPEPVADAVPVVSEVARADPVPPPPSVQPAPTSPSDNSPASGDKEVVVDDALMAQIVSALTSDDTFMANLASKVAEVTSGSTSKDQPAPMTEDTGKAVMQALDELERALKDVLQGEGEVSRSNAPAHERVVATTVSLKDKADKTLSKLKDRQPVN